MPTFFRDTFIGTGQNITGTTPQVGFVPAGQPEVTYGTGRYETTSMKRGANGTTGGGRLVYGLDVSDLGGDPGHGDGWVPGSADGWTAEWDWTLDYYSATDGSSQNHGEIQLGNARTKNVLVEFLQIGNGRIDLRLGHGATGYGNGSPAEQRVQCPGINATGVYHCRLEVTRTKFTLVCAGGQLELAVQNDANAGGFNSIVFVLQSLLKISNLEISTGVPTPPQPVATFWTGYVDTVET